MSHVIIELLDGTKIDSRDIDMFFNRFDVSPPTLKTTFDEIDGRHGNIDYGATYEARTIEGEGFFKSYDKASFPFYRERLIKAFSHQKPFFISDSRQPYKRWLVRVDGGWSADRIPLTKFGEFSISFVTSGLPFATSGATTLEPREWEENGWWWGSDIEWSDETYVYSSPTFTVPNFGDVAVDPRFMDLKITFDGPSLDLRLRNNTTDEEWQLFDQTFDWDTIIIDGIRTMKNGVSVVRATNRQLVSLAPGNNEFEILGTNGAFTVSFEFRYHYI